MKALVIGCGSIGQRHIHNLKKLKLKNLVAYDIDKNKIKFCSKKYNIQTFSDLNSALSFKPDFSIICTFPSSHLTLANTCIDNNSHIFVEKPISNSINGLAKMLTKASSKKLKVGVGYNMRYDDGLRHLKTILLKKEISSPLSIFTEWGHNIKLWQKNSNYKNHYVLKKGGGIILDDSHEYDYLRWLLNDEVKSVYCQTKKINDPKTQTESLASIILKFKKGCIANLLIDYVRPKYQRMCHVIGEKGDLLWEFKIQNKKRNYSTKVKSTVTTNLLKNNITKTNNFLVRLNDMYIKELQNFIQSVKNKNEPNANGWDALKTLKIGLAALESAKKDKVIRL